MSLVFCYNLFVEMWDKLNKFNYLFIFKWIYKAKGLKLKEKMLPNRHNSDLDVSKFIKFTPQE